MNPWQISGCEGKDKLTRGQADQVRRRVTFAATAYECPHCGHWHVANSTGYARASKRGRRGRRASQVTLVLVPPGRGRWHTVEVNFNGKRSPLPLLYEFRKGQRFELGGKVFRIAEVRP